jgi:hypothetical protein
MSFNVNRSQYTITMYNDLIKRGKYTFPTWQRQDCWTPEFKKDLILAILNGIDIPKIYTADIKEKKDIYIIDGGNRSRAISGFINNEFSVKIESIDSSDVFYDSAFEKETRNKRKLTDEERNRFNDFELDVVKYSNISEKECRGIFNKLQNSKPMSIDDVINSWQSELVDYIRELLDYKIFEEITLFKSFESCSLVAKPTKTKIMTQLMSWFTIKFPILTHDIEEEKEIKSLMYLCKGNSSSSPTLKYLKRYDDDDLTDKIKRSFVETLKFILQYDKDHIISPADMYTLIHSKLNFDTFDITKFKDFLLKVKEYEQIMKSSNKHQSIKEYDKQAEQLKKGEELNTQYKGNLEVWAKSKKDGGNNPSGMKKRMTIIKAYCL